MKTYSIFPDYCATGCWLSDNMTITEVILPEYVSDSCRVALKYWCDVWEFTLESKSNQYKKEWLMDGEVLVRELNSYGVDKYELNVDEEYAFIKEK